MGKNGSTRRRRNPTQSKGARAQRARRAREKMVPEYDKYIKSLSMAYCCVAHCTSQWKKTPGVTFHKFPLHPELRDKWTRAIPRKNWNPNSSNNCFRVCSNHFLNSDFNQYTVKRELLKTAVPSVFKDYLEWLQPQKRTKQTSEGESSNAQSTTDSIENSLTLEDFIKNVS